MIDSGRGSGLCWCWCFQNGTGGLCCHHWRLVALRVGVVTVSVSESVASGQWRSGRRCSPASPTTHVCCRCRSGHSTRCFLASGCEAARKWLLDSRSPPPVPMHGIVRRFDVVVILLTIAQPYRQHTQQCWCSVLTIHDGGHLESWPSHSMLSILSRSRISSTNRPSLHVVRLVYAPCSFPAWESKSRRGGCEGNNKCSVVIAKWSSRL